MAMREYNTYDMYGLLQGLIDALGKHANAIPLQARVELAKSFIDALPEHADSITSAPVLTKRELYERQLESRPPRTPETVFPTLSPFAELIAN